MTNSAPHPLGRRTSRLLGLAASAALAAVVLTGCSGITNALEKVHEESFENVRSAESGWKGVDFPTWIPDDGTGIRNLATTNESGSVVYVATESDPIGCEEADRRGLPFDDREWIATPDPLPDTVWACGDYEVTRADGGLLGWFNATESGQKPGS
ncbi:hypothetical protein CLV46_3011 [Diaminobutyricimonas aerilata]|uniref:Lipoprotein n=1 Tax=Diaminobutyricimonas aerilata TaxID=1162967 RepID=A0A2M9CND3_9MICO|nr:hypothetical protein [Diaminobutyricimonas aerilata]PJJ73419.1 hypothetical protein CLV46_3011 [Diaminobutyricimonas aerilata]